MTDSELVGSPTPQSSSTLQRARRRARQRTDFETFYRKHIAGLVWLVRAGTSASVEEAWDAAQAAMLEAWNKWEDVEKPLAYVRTVAVRTFYRQIRKLTITDDGQATDMIDAALTPDLVAELSESTTHTVQLLQRLTPALRLPFALHLDGMKVPEIAELTGKTEDTIRRNLSRARAAIRKIIACRGGAG